MNFLTGISKPPAQVYNVLCELVAVTDATFRHADTITRTFPPSDNPSPLRYFLSLPEFHAPAKYEADLKLPAKEMDSCRKLSYGHPTLSPSTFTICCQHGVCYSYEVTAQCESPKIPFQIFSLAFPNHLVWLSMIMHANCMSTAWIENLGTSKTHSSW